MSIATLGLSQQQSYQQTSAQTRKVTLLRPEQLMPEKEVPEQTRINNRNTAQPESSLLNKIRAQTPVNTATIQSNTEDLTYDKPKEAKLQVMVLVLERFLGRQLSFSDFSFFTANTAVNETRNATDFAELKQNLFTAATELVNIDGQSFQQGDLLSIEQWTTSKQQLNYQVQGTFNLNEQELSLNYNFALSSESTSYSKTEITAAALKDPLIVQFGSQGLGAIIGQKDFAINKDDIIDNLPLFSGDVGYLVFDKNNNQQADNGSELFGPKTGQGFAELALLDSNKNGFIDAEDQQFEQLYLWQPSESNTQAEQWLSLKEAKIQAISLSAINTPFDFYDQQGQIQAKLRQSSFAISDEGYGRGVHQVDVRI